VIFHLSYRIRFIILCFFPRENTAKVYIRAREQFPVYNFRRPLSFSSLSYPVRFGRAFPARRATRNQRSGDKFPCARARTNEPGSGGSVYTGNAQVGLFGREYRKWNRAHRCLRETPIVARLRVSSPPLPPAPLPSHVQVCVIECSPPPNCLPVLRP